MNKEELLIFNVERISLLFNQELNDGLNINDVIRKYNRSGAFVNKMIYKKYEKMTRVHTSYDDLLSIKKKYDTMFKYAARILSNTCNEQTAYLLGYFYILNNTMTKIRESNEHELKTMFGYIKLLSNIDVSGFNENDMCVYIAELHKVCMKHFNNIPSQLYRHFIRGMADNYRCIQSGYDAKANHTKPIFRVKRDNNTYKAMNSLGYKLTIKQKLIEISGAEKIRQFYKELYDGATVFDAINKEKTETIISKKPFNRKPAVKRVRLRTGPPRTPQQKDHLITDIVSLKEFIGNWLHFRLVKPKSKIGIGNATITISVSNCTSDVVGMLKKHLDIDSKLAIRAKPKREVNVQIFGMSNLIKLYDALEKPLINEKFKQHIGVIKTELENRIKLMTMVRHDYNNGTSISALSTKYGPKIKVIKRIVANQINEYKMLLHITPMANKLNSMEICKICNQYKEAASTKCIYCTTPKGQLPRSPLVVSRDYSSQIRRGIEKLLAGKDTSGYTIQYHTDWTFPKLKEHIENQFEPWMNWGNWKQYSARKWNENDQSTWVWNIDHIIPQSEFIFRDKTDPAFKQCWALNNLRPYSGKQNSKDGASRIRHNKLS